MNDHPTFEETYPSYEFSELVRLGIALGGNLRMLRLAKAPWRSAPALDQVDPTRAMMASDLTP